MTDTNQKLPDTEFYRNIIQQIGDLFGDAAKTADDGTVTDAVIATKVFDLVRGLKMDVVRGELSRQRHGIGAECYGETLDRVARERDDALEGIGQLVRDLIDLRTEKPTVLFDESIERSQQYPTYDQWLMIRYCMSLVSKKDIRSLDMWQSSWDWLTAVKTR